MHVAATSSSRAVEHRRVRTAAAERPLPEDRAELGDRPSQLSSWKDALVLMAGKPCVLPVQRVAFEATDDLCHHRELLLCDGRLLVTGKKGLYFFSPDGRLTGQALVGDCSYYPPVEDPSRNRILVLRQTDEDSRELAAVSLDSSRPEVLWSKSFGRLGLDCTPAVDSEGRVYQPDREGALHVLDRGGNELTRVSWPHLSSRPPCVQQDGKILLAGREGRRALLDPSDLPGRWARWLHLGGPVLQELPAVLEPSVGHLKAGSSDGSSYEQTGGEVRRLAADGNQLWTRPVPCPPYHLHAGPRGLALMSGGNIHSREWKLYALRPEDGGAAWDWTPPGGSVSECAVDPEDRIYVRGDLGNWSVSCLNRHGHLLWRRELDDVVDGRPLPGPCGTLLVGGEGNPFWVLDRNSGEVLHREDDSSYSDPPYALRPDGTLQLVTRKGELVTLRLARAAAPADLEPAATIRRGEKFVEVGHVSLPVKEI